MATLQPRSPGLGVSDKHLKESRAVKGSFATFEHCCSAVFIKSERNRLQSHTHVTNMAELHRNTQEHALIQTK